MSETREEWLEGATARLRPIFDEQGYSIPDRVRVACGWPSRAGVAARNRRIGECWAAEASAERVCNIFISPCLDNPVEVLAVLVHELVHAVVGLGAKHGPIFRKCAVAVGLTGKMTATTPTPELVECLNALGLPAYPHGKLTPGLKRTKQTTRLIRVVCPACGYTARIANKWLDESGCPTCPCGQEMARKVTA